MQKRLDELAAAELLRRPATIESASGPSVQSAGRRLTCMCANDYLCLAGDEAVKAAAVEAIGRWGVGAGASRLVSGTTSLHVELERRLGRFKGTEAAVVTSTGWMANLVAIHAMARAGDAIFCDKLNHASIIDAAVSSGARVRTYPHRDVARLESLLQKHRHQHRRCLIVTDSLFSMDGDLAPLRELAELKCRFDAELLIDEAHATGVLGERGRGAAEMLGVEDRVDVVVGTLSKAVGSLGGFVAGPNVLIETIRNTGRAFIYTTALPAAMCAAAIAALEIIETQPQRRLRLLALADQMRRRLAELGFSTGDSVSQIMPVIIGSPAEALAVSKGMLARGFLVPAIRPPTVPRGTSRLRVSLCAGHCEKDVSDFTSALAEVRSGL